MTRRWKVPTLVAWGIVALSLAIGPAVCSAAPGGNGVKQEQMLKKFNKVTPAEQKAAAKRAQDLGLLPGVAGMAPFAAAAPLPGIDGPGGIPHYFGPYGNWAFSPLPTGGVATLTLTGGGGGYTNPVVFIGDAYGTGSGATATATVDAAGVVTGLAIVDPGTGYSAPVVRITDTVPGPGAGADATATLAPSSIESIAVDAPGSGYVAPIVTINDPTGAGATATATFDPTTGEILGITVDASGSGYTAPTVEIVDDTAVCGTDPLLCGTGAGATATLAPSSVESIVVVLPGTGYLAPIVTITDPTGTGAAATATFDPATGEILGIVVDAPGTAYTAPTVTITDTPVPGTGAGATADAAIGGPLAGGLLKFVDGLPQLTPAGVNNLGQYIPVAVPDTTTYAGSDYYEIALVEFDEKMHSDLPPTRQRGYVQLSTGVVPGDQIPLANPDGTPIMMPDGVTQAVAVDNPHFLGPTIVAKGRAHGVPGLEGQQRPVRIKFYNLLPAGSGGDLFLPVDESVMGAGLGPALPGTAGDKYTQNRATVHLHGNNTVWLSDGNVHQWITPADEITPYPAGVSARNVPDMDGCASDPTAPLLPGSSGCMTFFYSNAQSARLQFYHDHAMGITRLNVYAGEAAGYVLTDAVENDLIAGTNVSGVNPDGLQVLPGLGIPLVIQDRTFVDADTVFAQDPTWNGGTGPRDPATGNITGAVTGDLWYPHVYMTVQNPWDLTGTNGVGRWHYGPWFNPPVPECVNGLPVGCIEVGPVPNEYYDPVNAPWEPPMRPGLPNPSMPGESFLDTPIVNGTAYPYLEVEPKAYRFRVLNAANDRMFNLQLYVAADKNSPTTADTTGAVLCDGAVAVENCTEVAMVPVSVAPANQFADTPSGIPDPATAGPPWIQIGTEGGFMPKPVVLPQQPVGYNVDPAYFSFGLVNQHSLFLGSAERADVIVDFSGYAGKTLILYNDSPAPVPAGAAPYDNYTGAPSQVDAGGAPTTLPGYGPNTRTIMQIRVTKPLTTPTTDVTLANLEAVFAKTDAKRGVFELTQDPIIIPQEIYNSAYNNTFPTGATEQYIQIADTQKTFQPIDALGDLQPAVTLPLELKAMHDEMGGVYDTLFGRMSGMLGLSLQNSPNHVLIPYGLASPPTDLVKGSVEGTPIGVMPDGTQIWRIFHNGVDTHTIHTHLFHTQLINRVDQSGQVTGGTEAVDPTEYGWKDTFRVNPLEVTYLAMRPTVPTPDQVPFEVPDSVRLIDPTLPEGATLIPPPPAGWFDPAGNQIPEILNHFVNFGWEYVWHCHILSHEEMDMMHTLVFAVPPLAPTALVAALTGPANNPRVALNWTDNSDKETQFVVQRATDANFGGGLTTFVVAAQPGSGTLVAYTDTSVARDTQYWYRVFAIGGIVGDVQTAGFPVMSADSVSGTVNVLTGTAPTAPADPTNLAATLEAGPQVSLTWRDNANNETGFVIERADNGGAFVQIATAAPRNNTGNVTYVDATVAFGNSYLYQVKAFNAGGSSAYVTLADPVVVPAIPAAPTNFTVVAVKANGNNYTATLNWVVSAGASDYTIERAENLTFTTNLNTSTVAGALGTATETVRRNTVYYYRIRANNGLGGSSNWTNALPFPIRTGP